MGFDERRINHHVVILGIFEEPGEDRFPNAVLGPATETFVEAFPFAVTLGQIMPVRPAAQTPQHAVDKAVIVFSGAPRVADFAGQKITDGCKLRFG